MKSEVYPPLFVLKIISIQAITDFSKNKINAPDFIPQ